VRELLAALSVVVSHHGGGLEIEALHTTRFAIPGGVARRDRGASRCWRATTGCRPSRARSGVEDGKHAVGKVLRAFATFDHRVLDGMHAARMSKTLKRVFADPEKELGALPTE